MKTKKLKIKKLSERAKLMKDERERGRTVKQLKNIDVIINHLHQQIQEID